MSRSKVVDRAMIERHLALAERHVSEGERRLTRQRNMVAELERQSHDATRARGLLAQFEVSQMLHVAHRDRLHKELGLS